MRKRKIFEKLPEGAVRALEDLEEMGIVGFEDGDMVVSEEFLTRCELAIPIIVSILSGKEALREFLGSGPDEALTNAIYGALMLALLIRRGMMGLPSEPWIVEPEYRGGVRALAVAVVNILKRQRQDLYHRLVNAIKRAAKNYGSRSPWL